MASYDLKAILGEKLKRLTDKTLKALVDCMCTVGASLCSLDKRVSALESVELPEGGYKPIQEPVASPTASGTAMQFIESVSQDATGRMTAIKKTVQDGTTSQKGVVQLEDSHTSTSTSKAATPNAVKKAYDLAEGKQDVISDLSTIRSGAAAGATAIQSVKVNGTALTPDSNKAVDIAVPTASSKTPKMDGSASAGSETKWAKGDHRHPTDTSREAAANKKTTLDATSDTDFPTSKAVGTYVGTAIANKVDKMSAWLKTSSGDSKSQWFTLASLNSVSTYSDISGIWDLYLKTRGQNADGKYVMHALLELSVYTGRYDGNDGTHEQTSPTVRKARLIAEPGWPVEILLRITGKTGNVTVEIMTGNFVAITGGNPCAFYMSERAKSYVNQTREWTYGTYETSDTGSDTRPVSGDNVTVISLDETNASGKYVYRWTELYKENVVSTYLPASDAPVNGLALADALANGTAAKAVIAEKLVPGQTGIGNAFTPIYVTNDGTPTICDTKLMFVATYNSGATGVTNTPFADIRNAYNLGRIIVLLIKVPDGIAYCGTLSYIDATSARFFVCLQESSSGSLMEIGLNSNDVWSVHSIKVTFSSQGAPNGALGSQSNPLSLVYSTSFVGDVTGKADSADKINTDAGSHTVPVYFKNGIPKLSNCRFVYSVDNSGNYSTIQYKICVGSIGTTPNTFYFT